MASFRLAVDQGATGLECDVHLSADGELMVCHDERVDRTTDGQGWIREMTLAELRRLDAGKWRGPQFSGERLPLLLELIELCKEHDIFLNVELKSGVVAYPGIEAKVAELLKRQDMVGQSIVSSFNHYSLQELKRLLPEVKIGLLYACGLVDPWIYAERLAASALHPVFYAVTPELVQGCHAHGLRVYPWTVDGVEDMRRMIDAGVDGVITNRPDELTRLLRDAQIRETEAQ